MKMEALRNGKRWSVNECLQLHREFELLNLSVVEIAVRHNRTPKAIMFKLDQEGLADYNVLYLNSNIHSKKDFYNVEDDEEYESKDNVSELSNEKSEQDDDIVTDLKNKLNRLEKQVLDLTDLLSKQVKNKSLF